MILSNSVNTTGSGIPDSLNPQVNLAVGGWDGLNPGYGTLGEDGNVYSMLIANQPYVKRPAIFVMLTYPMAFGFYPNKTDLIATLKNLTEKRATVIEGLNNQINLELGEVAISGTNESYKVILDSKKEASSISFTWNEKDGKPIYRFHEWYLNDICMHHNSKIPEVTKLASYSNTKTYGADMYTFSGMVIEPDVSNRYVVDAYLGENLFPASTGESTTSKNRGEAGTTVDVTIEYGGYWESSKATRKFAQQLLNVLVSTSSRYDNEALFVNKIDANVSAAKAGLNLK